VLHPNALPGNPYDGHTLGDVIDATEKLAGCTIERANVDKGYRGHNASNPRHVFISGQKRGVFGAIKRELRRRSEPVIGHRRPMVTSATSRAARATPPTSASPPSATTSASSSIG
jgi:IS5 family transposase